MVKLHISVRLTVYIQCAIGSITNPNSCLTYIGKSWNFIIWISAVPPFYSEKDMIISVGQSGDFKNMPINYFILLFSRGGASFSLPCVWAWLSNLLLTNKIRQKWSCVTLEPRSSKGTVASVLVILSLGSPVLGKASLHVLRRGAGCQQDLGSWIFASSFEWARSRSSSPSWEFRWLLPWRTSRLQPHEKPWARGHPAKLLPKSCPRETVQ